MSIININNTGVTERDLEQNWAAAYAKRLIDTETSARETADADLSNSIAVLEGAVEAAQQTADSKLGFDDVADLEEVRVGSEDSKYITPYRLKYGVGYLIEPSIINGNLAFENVPFPYPFTDIISINNNPIKDATAREQLARLSAYSTTPQMIGKWIDGTPIWRAAFKAPITDTMKTDKACSIFYDLSFVKSAERVKLVIGGFACIDNGSVVDNNTTTLDGFGRFNWDSINPNAEYISGYIDFVTEAENIKS